MKTTLVPDRVCGACTTCCTAMMIDQPELTKLAGETCQHCFPQKGCTIYEARPQVCRSWFCGWRKLDWVGATLRPDLSDVLVKFVHEDVPPNFAAEMGIGFMILAPTGLRAEGLVDAIAASLRRHFATYFIVPVKDGRTSMQLLLNERLAPAVNAAALLQVLVTLYAEARSFCDLAI